MVPEERISYGDVGLAHAGRNASSDLRWRNGKQITAGVENGLQAETLSAIPFNAGGSTPAELTRQGVYEIRAAFAAAAV